MVQSIFFRRLSLRRQHIAICDKASRSNISVLRHSYHGRQWQRRTRSRAMYAMTPLLMRCSRIRQACNMQHARLPDVATPIMAARRRAATGFVVLGIISAHAASLCTSTNEAHRRLYRHAQLRPPPLALIERRRDRRFDSQADIDDRDHMPASMLMVYLMMK